MSYVELMKRGGNEAIQINAPTGVDFHLTARGSDWLFSAFCFFLVLGLITIGLMFRKPAQERIFYMTAVAPLLFMAFTYFTVASDLGWTGIRAKYNHEKVSTQTEFPGIRQIFYARYVGWFLAMPWNIIAVGLMTGTPWIQTAFNIGMTEGYVVLMLIGSLVHSTYKWGYFSLAIACSVCCCTSLMTTSRNLAIKMGKDVFSIFDSIMGVIMFLWWIYPICFGISEGGNVIAPNSEAVFYGVLDCLLLGFLPCIITFLASTIGLERIGLIGNSNNFSVMPNEKSMNSIATARHSGETAVSPKSGNTPASPTP
ncbi:LAFE_0E04258g1_1 [Lachancea fermentati]|uniref:LAFE_0E04258g1_1 n=1 Tax=Lachancea fermentati TaxID=4955 RepID=A0A1G4MCY1_LACFM|nr:LAFE_0E04258g1_1 [Lachancea fermentati]